MIRQILFFVVLFCYTQSTTAQYNYPHTKTVDSTDTWHNVTVKDPYRWLEDLKNSEVVNWFKSQANFTDSVLNKLPYAKTLFNEMNKLDVVQPQQKFGIKRVCNAVFYNQVDPAIGKFKVYIQFDNTSLPQVIASPEMWGDNYNIYDYDIDPSEKYLAIYALEGGKEINNVKIYSIAANKILPDKITGSYKGFMNNQNGVFYYEQRTTYDPQQTYSRNDNVFKTHHIGTDTALDKVITSKQTNPELMSYTDERYLWEIKTFKGCSYEFTAISPSEIYYRRSGGTDKWVNLFESEDAADNIYYYNNKLYYISFKNAPNGNIKMLDLKNPSANPRTILAEQSDPLDYGAISQTKNYLIIPLKKNGITTYSKFIYLPTNTITATPFKEYTARTRYFGTNKYKNDSVFIVREDWANPVQLSYGNIASKKEFPSKYYNYTPLPFANNLMVEEIEVESYDGTRIPLTIIRRKDLKMNGNNIALLNGYGAYGDTWAPGFNCRYRFMVPPPTDSWYPHLPIHGTPTYRSW